MDESHEAGASAEELRARLSWERRARQLLQAVAMADATTPVAALRSVVEAVCRATGWPVGHALMRGAEGRLATCGAWYFADAERFNRLREVTEAVTFGAGEGLPGRVVETKRPAWIMDVRADENFPRRKIADDLAVRAAFGFPVIVRGEVVAVLEFFSPEPREPDEPLLDVMASLGTELAHTFERVAVAAELRESELRFRSLAHTAPDAIITANRDGHVVSWNPSAERLFGYSEAEMLGLPLAKIIPERLREAHERGVARVRDGGPHHVIGRTVELSGLRRDGTEFPLELSLATWQIDGERYYSGILRDVSERHRIAARLAASEKAAHEASRAKTVFLANMSHELRTPLNAILGFVQLMGRDRTLSPENREHLEVVLRSSEHLLGLINDVLSISKIEVGETEVSIADFDLARLVDSLRDMFQLRAQARGLELVVQPAREVPAIVRGDERKLRQVLINLLGNAVKFTASGRVVLRASYAAGRAAFEVEDTGPGISKEEQARLFQPFVQTQSGIDAKEGTGLGLAISQDFVRLMGGTLTLRSEPGEGSCFRLELPLPAGAGSLASRALGRVIGLAPGEAPRRVLVVDNADDNRLLLARLLSSVGFVVEEAKNGAEAVDAWSSFEPDVVWMDMRMPVMNGYEATQRIRTAEAARPGRARTVIIALTASAFEHDRPSILAAGCDAIIAKPFEEESIFDALSRFLGVRFVREEGDAAQDSVAVSLSSERLARLPNDVRVELARALSVGDDLAAQGVVDRLPSEHAAVAADLRRMVKSFRLDELLALLEEVSP